MVRIKRILTAIWNKAMWAIMVSCLPKSVRLVAFELLR